MNLLYLTIGCVFLVLIMSMMFTKSIFNKLPFGLCICLGLLIASSTVAATLITLGVEEKKNIGFNGQQQQ